MEDNCKLRRRGKQAHPSAWAASPEPRAYAPVYVSRATLAYLLELEASTIDAYVRAGLLPEAERVGRVKRWDTGAVLAFIRAQNCQNVGINGVSPIADDFTVGIQRHGTPANRQGRTA